MAKISKQKRTTHVDGTCPFCGSKEVLKTHSNDVMYVGSRAIARGCYCTQCQEKWLEIFMIVAIEEDYATDSQAEV